MQLFNLDPRKALKTCFTVTPFFVVAALLKTYFYYLKLSRRQMHNEQGFSRISMI